MGREGTVVINGVTLNTYAHTADCLVDPEREERLAEALCAAGVYFERSVAPEDAESPGTWFVFTAESAEAVERVLSGL